MKTYNERCCINGYKWGVEYETNGEKPNLPDDVLVEVERAWSEISKYTGLLGNQDWCSIEKFRIVDERYKPKEQEMNNNNWYEKGELPPVGAVVRHKESGKDVEIKCHLRTGQAIGERLCHPLIEIGFASDFEPLRTETDKLVDEAMSLFSKTEATMDAKQGIEHAVRKLINAGYRKIEPMSEDEFVDKVESLYGVRDLLVKELYRAGCRFLDQGETK